MFQLNKEQSTLLTRVRHAERHLSVTHLEALGCKRGDLVYIKAFLPKEDSRYGSNTGRKVNELLWEQIRWQNQGDSVTEQYLEQAESVGYASLEGTR